MDSFLIDGPHGPIAGDEVGEGPALLLIAGAGSTRRLWGELPRVLARTHRVVALDNRGVGGSRGGASFTLDRAVDDALAVLDARGCASVGVLGASMGGLLAMCLAIRAPERVRTMVVASAAARLTSHGQRSLTLMRDLVTHLPARQVGEALMALAFAPPFQRRFPGFVDEAAALYGLDPEDVPGALSQLDHLLAGWDLRPNLGAVHSPTLVVAGARDPLVAAEDTAEIAGCLTHSELIEVPDAGHSVLAEGGAPLLDRVLAQLEI